MDTCGKQVKTPRKQALTIGMATANAITAWQTGASALSVTINGLGERAGNASLEEIAMMLRQVSGNEITFYPKESNAPSDLKSNNPKPYSKKFNKENQTIEFSAETGDYYRKVR